MNPQRTLAVVMDPIADINPRKDSSLAMMLAAQARGWRIKVCGLSDLYLADGIAHARLSDVTVTDDMANWYSIESRSDQALGELDLILMRKDPPFDNEYLYATHLLELAETQGAMVVNRPRALRDFNEKLAIARFPQCTTNFIVSRDMNRLRAFVATTGDCVLKPLDGMGGRGIFRVSPGDSNTNSIVETLTHQGQHQIMAQRYIPEISAGDKRILLIAGRPFPHALGRLPAKGEFRGNLAAGGSAKGVDLSERDRWICAQVATTLTDAGLLFVGLDVIGDYLTEINVTSPTCIRELDAIYQADIGDELMRAIEASL